MLRTLDPECRDPRWHGRTLLPVAGCWLGGLGGIGAGTAVVAGAAAWVLGEFACLVVLWTVRRGTGTGPDAVSAFRSAIRSVAAAPLVVGIVVALVVSLTVAG